VLDTDCADVEGSRKAMVVQQLSSDWGASRSAGRVRWGQRLWWRRDGPPSEFAFTHSGSEPHGLPDVGALQCSIRVVSV
jgi:hypothetical protein